MRFVQLLAISAVLTLGCGDTSGVGSLCPEPGVLPIGCSRSDVSLEGPAFMQARIDTSQFSLDENDVLVWHFDGTTLVLLGMPGTASPAGFGYIDIQVKFFGPGTYPLEFALDSPGLGFYGVFAGDPPEPVASYQTLGGDNTGTLHISAFDSTLGVVAGTFAFKAIRNDGGTGVVRVTEGRFRIRTRLI